jgi:hypothetical protein
VSEGEEEERMKRVFSTMLVVAALIGTPSPAQASHEFRGPGVWSTYPNPQTTKPCVKLHNSYWFGFLWRSMGDVDHGRFVRTKPSGTWRNTTKARQQDPSIKWNPVTPFNKRSKGVFLVGSWVVKALSNGTVVWRRRLDIKRC